VIRRSQKLLRIFPGCNQRLADQRGAILVLVAVLATVLIGITALAVDIGHLMVVNNELQNAADAGALAGAQALYEDPDGAGSMGPGEEINTQANKIAFDTAILNQSEKIPVEVNKPLTNADDVQRGHWSFATRTFIPSDSLEVLDLFALSEDELDKMDGTWEYPEASGKTPIFINAVRVVARRQSQPAASFFARIFGYENFGMMAEAVGYVGFAGGILGPGEADQPIVICQSSLFDEGGNRTCNIGRMINSSNDPAVNNTAGWSDFSQDFSVCSGTNDNALKPLVCGGGNENEIKAGYGDEFRIAATGGTNADIYNKMRDCWLTGSANGTIPWEMTLPVVDCEGHNIGNCPEVRGAVTVNMVWMTPNGTAWPNDTPTQMASPKEDDPAVAWDFYNPGPGAFGHQCDPFSSQIDKPIYDALLNLPDGFNDYERWKGRFTQTVTVTDPVTGETTTTKVENYEEGMARWDCFVDHFKLRNADASYAPLVKKSMYFMPDCDPHDPKGSTGGPNFGVLAKRPVLVD